MFGMQVEKPFANMNWEMEHRAAERAAKRKAAAKKAEMSSLEDHALEEGKVATS